MGPSESSDNFYGPMAVARSGLESSPEAFAFGLSPAVRVSSGPPPARARPRPGGPVGPRSAGLHNPGGRSRLPAPPRPTRGRLAPLMRRQADAQTRPCCVPIPRKGAGPGRSGPVRADGTASRVVPRLRETGAGAACERPRAGDGRRVTACERLSGSGGLRRGAGCCSAPPTRSAGPPTRASAPGALGPPPGPIASCNRAATPAQAPRALFRDGACARCPYYGTLTPRFDAPSAAPRPEAGPAPVAGLGCDGRALARVSGGKSAAFPGGCGICAEFSPRGPSVPSPRAGAHGPRPRAGD